MVVRFKGQASQEHLFHLPVTGLCLCLTDHCDDVKETIKTDDNEIILVEHNGIISSGKALDRLSKGETLTANDVYWITAPKFTTASKKYAWLNQVQAIGKLVAAQSGKVRYDIFAVK